ncbi:hypothetical protein [Thermococcus barophilus]|uniref:Uncharacterized protein n=1 Tax=Thermococcus barophilus TaxID=55802 RepID=A0A0S1XFC6_THEBA|nr:hypothetical protein [Thermococcus barophilus]ALM76484.1 hypothetical protein TBCH5v1_2595 [Thermococcus barophilus]
MIYSFLYSNDFESLERFSGEMIELNVPAKDIEEATELALERMRRHGYKFCLIFVWTPEPTVLRIVDLESEILKSFVRWFG